MSTVSLSMPVLAQRNAAPILARVPPWRKWHYRNDKDESEAGDLAAASVPIEGSTYATVSSQEREGALGIS